MTKKFEILQINSINLMKNVWKTRIKMGEKFQKIPNKFSVFCKYPQVLWKLKLFQNSWRKIPKAHQDFPHSSTNINKFFCWKKNNFLRWKMFGTNVNRPMATFQNIWIWILRAIYCVCFCASCYATRHWKRQVSDRTRNVFV